MNERESDRECQEAEYSEDAKSDGHNEDEVDEQEDNKYRELSDKLEAALKKISSSKKEFGCTSSSTKVLQRFEMYEKKREREM